MGHSVAFVECGFALFQAHKTITKYPATYYPLLTMNELFGSIYWQKKVFAIIPIWCVSTCRAAHYDLAEAKS